MFRVIGIPLFVFFMVATLGVSFADQSQGYYYYSEGKKIMLNLSTEGIAIKFRKGTHRDLMRADVESEPELGPFSEAQELTVPEFILFKLKKGIGQDAVRSLVGRFEQKTEVEFVSPLFKQGDAKMIISNEIIVKFKASATDDDISMLIKRYSLAVAKKGLLGKKAYILKLKQGSGKNVLDIANTLHLNPIVEFAHPNFLRLLKPFATPNDPLFPNQWSLNNTGQNGWTIDADIDAPEAWDISTGSSTVTVAIIDEGVDLTHEDLSANMLPGYDATGQGSGGAPNSWDGHGTSCAGIVSAVTDNATGVAGVNWNVKILPVRIAYSPSSCKGCYWITFDSWIADGIQWAVDNGADVLSNSWGGGTPSNIINSAIQYAKANGRGGLGSIVVFAAGNDNGAVSYPATRPEVIAVGATSPCDERKSPTSCDGEWWWGSNYGPELDVSAPGVKIYTTDITGSGGYTAGNYISDFNGTSSATPHVAGLAALILSVDSTLSATEVETIIKNTADDLGSVGWDQYFGYGRINAYNALLALTSPSNTISGTITYSGTKTGTINVEAYTRPVPRGSTASSTTITDFGPYSLSGLTDGTYFVFSYIDSDGDGRMGPREAWGYMGYPGTPAPITVSGSDVAGVDFSLYDPGAIAGTLYYNGTDTGSVFVNVLLNGFIIKRRVLPGVGQYIVGGILPGTYDVMVFMDVNQNKHYDPGEPKGLYPSVTVNEGVISPGVNITLQ